MLLHTLRNFNAERDIYNKIQVQLRLLSGLLFIMNYSLFFFKSKSICSCLSIRWTVVYRPYATLRRISRVSFHLKISGLSSTRAHLITSSTKSWMISTCVFHQENGGQNCQIYVQAHAYLTLRQIRPCRWINLCVKLMPTIFLLAGIFYVVTRKYTNGNHAMVRMARQPEIECIVDALLFELKGMEHILKWLIHHNIR